MKTPFLYGWLAMPATKADGNGNIVTVHRATSMRKVEMIHRKAGAQLGLFSQLSAQP